jgi:hypothetical protein
MDMADLASLSPMPIAMMLVAMQECRAEKASEILTAHLRQIEFELR